MNDLILASFFFFLGKGIDLKKNKLKIKYPKLGPEWWGWYLASIPITWLFLKSTQLGVTGFGGSVWANRFLGFVVGMMVYAVLTQWFFDQEMTRKVWIQMGLCLSILFVQFYMK